MLYIKYAVFTRLNLINHNIEITFISKNRNNLCFVKTEQIKIRCHVENIAFGLLSRRVIPK